MANWYMQLPDVQDEKSYYRKANASGHLLEYFGNRLLSQTEKEDQGKYRRFREGQGAASGTIDIEIAVLSAMYNEARKCKKISADVIPGEFVTKGEVNPRRTITDEEFEILLNHADPDFKDFLICGYESAMRSSEICSLTPSQVHLNEPRISQGKKIRADYIDLGIFDTKTGARRTVPVSAELKEVLERRLKNEDPEDPIFRDKHGPYTKVRVSNKMKHLCKRAKVQHGDNLLNKKGERVGIVFHCFRRTRISKWVDMGYSDEIVRRASGHKTLKAYQRYVDLDPGVVMRLVATDTPEKTTENDIITEQVAENIGK